MFSMAQNSQILEISAIYEYPRAQSPDLLFQLHLGPIPA